MKADDRILLLDLENLTTVQLRPRPLRARLDALLDAAHPVHHVVAAYALAIGESDPIASLLAELRIAPLRVAPGPDAAELALLDHARYVHAEGGRIFLVGSADRRFVELVDLGRVELLVWEGQPISAKLEDAVHHVHRVTRPTGATTTDTLPDESSHDAGAKSEPVTAACTQRTESPAQHRPSRPDLATTILTAFSAGAGLAAGHRLTDTLLRAFRRR